MISGKPVKSLIARTVIPASSSSRAVPPVETISMPSSASPCAKSTRPVLSETDSSARLISTSPGWVTGGTLPIEAEHHGAEQLVLERPDGGHDVVGRRRVRELDRALGDDPPGVDALVEVVDGDAEDLDPLLERPLDGAQARERRQQRWVDVDDAVGEA